MKFDDKLMELRKKKGWSQEELGEKLDVSRQTVSKWELGQTTPEMSKLIEIGGVFDISLDELLDTKHQEEKVSKDDRYYYGRRYRYEYKSKRTLFDLPLVHINVGRGMHRAKGIIAIGTIATGFISIGVLSFGLISIGALCLGILLSLGAFSLGTVSIGGIAAGIISLGGVSLGVFSVGGLSWGIYSVGGAAFGKNIALGGYANAPIAIGEMAKGDHTFLLEKGNDVNKGLIRNTILTRFPNTIDYLVRFFSFTL